MTHSTTRSWHLLAVLLLCASLLAGCGGQDEGTSAGGSSQPTPGSPIQATAGVPGEAGGSVSGGDQPAITPQPGTAEPGVAATGAPQPEGGQGESVATGCPQSAQGAQVAFWNGFSGPDGRFMQNLVERFNQENSRGVRVEMTIQPFTEYYNQLNAAAASGTLPDIAQIHLDQIATQAARGLIRPMPQEALDIIGVGEADFPAAVWAPGEFRGERYSIPLDIHPMVMYYNQEQLQAAGISGPPTTREEFEQAAQALTKGEAMGWSVTTGFPIVGMFQTLLHQFGGSEFNADGTEVTWNSEAGVQALQYLKDAQTKYARPNLPVDAGISAFQQGNAAIEWNGIWQIPTLTGERASFGAAAPIPQIGDSPAVWAGSHQLALTVQQQPDASKTAGAACFISWVSANSAEWAKGGQIPARNEVREGSAFAEIEPQATIAPSVEHAFFLPPVPGITDAVGGPQAPLEQAVVAVMTGRATDVKQALDEAAQRGEQILRENAQRYGG